MESIEFLLKKLVESAKIIGLSNVDLINAQEFLDNYEFGLCFDTIISQIYEYDIEINSEFYDFLGFVAKKIHLPEESYSFMNELIRSEGNIPKVVKDEIAKLIATIGNVSK
jgi:hypothetical protein